MSSEIITNSPGMLNRGQLILKKILFIANPKAGQKKKDGFLIDIINRFEDSGYYTELHFTRCAGDATRLVKQFGYNASIVVCMGGDGTLNEVVKGVLESGYTVDVGYIPAGTTNDFATSLNIPMVPEQAAKLIIERKPKRLDVGWFNGRHFIYTASCGIFTRSSYETSQNFKNIFGHFAYILSGITDLMKVKELNLRIQCDDGEYRGKYIFAAMCNATSIGGIMSLDKGAVDFCDGVFELLLVKFPKDPIELAGIIASLQNQKYNEKIQLIKTTRARILGCKNVDWSLDGEKEEGSEPVEIKVIQGAINFIY